MTAVPSFGRQRELGLILQRNRVGSADHRGKGGLPDGLGGRVVGLGFRLGILRE
jgi:hypothetical protein